MTIDGVNELSRKTFEKVMFGYAEYQCMSCLVASELSKSNIGMGLFVVLILEVIQILEKTDKFGLVGLKIP